MYELGKEFGCLWRNGLEETWEAVGGAQGDHSEELRRPDATGNVHSGSLLRRIQMEWGFYPEPGKLSLLL